MSSEGQTPTRLEALESEGTGRLETVEKPNDWSFNEISKSWGLSKRKSREDKRSCSEVRREH